MNDILSINQSPLLTNIAINPKPTTFTLMVGEAARVVISLETGKVTLEGCTPDEGARAFWDAIERMGAKG